MTEAKGVITEHVKRTYEQSQSGVGSSVGGGDAGLWGNGGEEMETTAHEQQFEEERKKTK